MHRFFCAYREKQNCNSIPIGRCAGSMTGPGATGTCPRAVDWKVGTGLAPES